MPFFREAPAMILAFAALALAGCHAPASVPLEPPKVFTDPAQARRVMVVINMASEDSRDVGAFYRKARSIPAENVLTVEMPEEEEISMDVCKKGLLEPLQAKLKACKNPIDYIVLTKGVPIRIGAGGYSVDGHVATVNLNLEPIRSPVAEQIKKAVNPYFNRAEPFSSKKYGFYLVTRLDGYNADDAKALVTNSLQAKAEKGPFLFDADPTRTENGYGIMQSSLLRAADVLKTKGFETDVNESASFVGSLQPVAGYASWGSNDRGFRADVYRSIKFLPGALAETFVSTSGRTFKHTSGGQSLITDLIKNGVTGIKGYVSEPYTFALAKPDILFDRYTSGFNLADSFYMASMVLKWKDLVIGDPLCNPYAPKPASK